MRPEHGRVVRLDDPDRREPWTAGLQPADVVVFSTYDETGVPCDADGQPLASTSDVTCLVFDRLDDARSFCEARVKIAPHVRFEIYDSSGRINPPLRVIVSQERAHTLAGDPRSARTRRVIALALIAGSLPLFWLDYQRDGLLILPTFLGINMLIIGARLLFMNLVVRETESARKDRLARYKDV